MKLYLYVTNDEYELPVAVADSPHELAKMLGVSANTVSNSIYKERIGKTAHSQYKKIEVDDD